MEITSTASTRRRYPKEFKENAVAMVLGPPRRPVEQVARELGISGPSLGKWVKQYEVDSGRIPGLTTEEQKENARLRTENARLARERDLLKRMIAFWITDSAR